MARKARAQNKLTDSNGSGKPGRPTIYTPELAARICKAISTSTKSLKQICKENDGFPCTETIHAWRYDREDFSVLYVKAKQRQAELIAEELLEISDDKTEDLIAYEGGYRSNSAAVNRARLMVDTRKWIACKLLPKVYGDKLQVNNDDDVNKSINKISEALEALKKQNARDY